MSLEKEFKNRRRKADLQNIILSTVEVGGLIAIATLAPNVIGAMGKLGMMPHQRQNESIKSTRNRLIKRGLLKYTNGKLEITSTGKLFLNKKNSLRSVQKRKWDGRWRVLIFDIPEKRKRDRELLRRTLVDIGFLRLQNSVWIYPYDCEELIALLKADMKIGKDILYMIVDMLEHDRPVKKFFKLDK